VPTQQEAAAFDPLQDALRKQAAAEAAAQQQAATQAAAQQAAAAGTWNVPQVADAAATASQAAAASGGGGDPPNMLIFGVMLIPIGYLGATKFVEFVNTRFDEITAEQGGGVPTGGPMAPPPMFPSEPAAPGGNAAGQQAWAERQAEMEVMRASSWYAEQNDVGRSAPDIFLGGLQNLMEDPKGWLFGAPSPLYSNLPATPPEVPTAPPAAFSSAAANPGPFAAPPAEASGFGAPAADAELASFLSKPTAAPTPAPPAAAAAPGPAAAAGMSGRVVSTASPSAKRRGKRKGSSLRAPSAGGERTPPQSPEEVEAARRGEYDYYADK
jgi:hypothetical protein